MEPVTRRGIKTFKVIKTTKKKKKDQEKPTFSCESEGLFDSYFLHQFATVMQTLVKGGKCNNENINN